MKIAVIGATGNAGSRIVTELLSRGHQILGIARHPDKMQPRPGLTLTQGDVKDEAGLAQLLTGQEVAIHSVRFLDTSAQSAIGAAKKAGVQRFLVVGGAGSLEVAPGSALVDTPNFPPAYKAEASGGRDFLNALKTERELDWAFNPRPGQQSKLAGIGAGEPTLYEASRRMGDHQPEVVVLDDDRHAASWIRGTDISLIRQLALD